MQDKNKRYFEELEGQVVKTGQCSGCAACVLVCSRGVLDYVNETPFLKGKCSGCGLCHRSCQRLEFLSGQIERNVYGAELNLDENPFGPYQRLSISRLRDQQTRDLCQDGGVVTGLLTLALESGYCQGAIVAGRNPQKGYLPEPRLVANPADLKATAGTCYTFSPNLLAIRNIKPAPDSLILVGTPCHINAYRQCQAAGLKKVSPIRLGISLFCSSSFKQELLDKFEKDLGIPLQSIRKTDIKGKFKVYLDSGEVREIPLKEVKQYNREGCKSCHDFSGMYSDISVGGLGLNGWSITIARTQAGMDLMSRAESAGILESRPVEDFPVSMDLLLKLSKTKLAKRFAEKKNEKVEEVKQ